MNINVKLRKQMMSILLCFALLMSYIPLSAFAAEEQANITVTCGEQTAEYNDLKEALANEWVINSTADVPATLTLNNDISIEGSFYINGGNVILDLNGNKIVGASGTSEYLFEITAGTVTVKGSDSISNMGRGVFKIWGYSSLALYDCEVISEEADSTILNIGTFNLYNASIVSDSIGVHSDETFNFYGGSIISEGIGIKNAGELSLFSGSITSKQYGVENEINRTVNIDGIVDISGEFGDFLINLGSILNINCDLGETVYSFALVKSNEDYNGAFAVPGDGITLNKDCFQLSHPYYLYEKDGDSTLYISECDHTTGTLDNEYRCSICGHIPEYETYVDGVAVTLANQDDVLGDGTVKFVPAANEGEADILYLNGVNISVSENNIFQGVATVGIYSENALIIDVSGNNCIAITPDIENSVGVVSEKNLTFQGEGVLNVTVADGLVAVGIVSNTGDITIDTDVSVNIDCVEPEADSEKMICNLIALGDVINNGSLKFTGENKTVSIEGTATCGENAKHPYDDESKCVLCGETCNHSENTNSVYTSNGEDTHSLICSICGNAVNGNESHIVAYKSNDSECVITAYCSVCGETLGTVSVEVNDKTYDGAKAEAVLTKTGSLENTNVTVEWEYEGGLVSSEAPSNAGSYKVSIRIGSAIATDSFTIARAALTGISVNGYSGEYDGDTHSISISNVPSGATVKYSTSENGRYTMTKPTYTEKGTYEVWYKIEKENYETVSGSASVVIIQATNSWTSEPSINGWTYGEIPNNPNSAAKYGEVNVEYRLVSETDEDYTTTVPTDAGNYLVRFSVAGTENYTSLSEVVGMEVAKVKLTVTADDKSKTYGESDPELTYQITEGQLVDSDTLEDISISRAGGEDADNYTITVSDTTGANPNYDITFKGGTFTINQKEVNISWGATMYLPYTGDSLVPKANVTNLVAGDECILTTEVVETADGAGIIPGTWTAKVTALSNKNYKLPESGERVTATFEVVNGYQNYAPNGVEAVNETIDGKADGKIIGVDSTMEYRKADETDYTAISGTEITDLADGMYYVRYAAKTYYNASPAKEVVIGIGNRLTVTVPTTQTGYTLTVADTKLVWNGSTTITFALADSYSKTNDFAVKVNGNEVELDENGQYVITNAQENITVTVEGVADITAPTTEIKLGTNKWNTFLSNITFGLFFKENQNVIITANDTGSGVKSIQYFLANNELRQSEVEQITDWIDYTGAFNINPDNKYVIYAKVTDNAGNIVYINSNGVVLDETAPIISGIENYGVYYGNLVFSVNDDYLDTVKIDGDEIELNNLYEIIADDNKHTITATDKAGNVTEYKITVYKKYMVTYTDGNGSEYEKLFKYGEDITIPTNEIFKQTFYKEGYTIREWQGYTEGMTMPLENLTFTAVYDPCKYIVTFDQNGGEEIAPINVTFAKKYGNLPSSSVVGLSGGNKNWYLIDADGNVTDTNTKNSTFVNTARDHKLFIKRSVLAPSVSIALTVPGGISDKYQYYIPGASQRVLTASIGNKNTDILNYKYQWYKDGILIEGATSDVLTLDGNVSDSGTYKVEVTAILKDNTNIVVTSDTATSSKEQEVKILHAANTINYDVNGGEGGPQSSYTGGSTLNVSKDLPTRAHYDFIGWNTAADGTGDSYSAEDIYTFVDDNGNGGSVVTLYAQWKLVEHTVTYIADGETILTEMVGYGKDATLPAVPQKVGYTGKWDQDGKNITADTEINAIYTINKYVVTYKVDDKVVETMTVEHGKDATAPAVPMKAGYVGKWDKDSKNITSDIEINVLYTKVGDVVSDDVKVEDKAELDDIKNEFEDMLKDDSYTDEDKKNIQDAIDQIDDILEVIENVESVEDMINQLPESITKDDEDAIKMANAAYNALSDEEKTLVDSDVKKILEAAKVALAELNSPVTNHDSLQTGDNNNIWLWIVLLFVSGAGIFGMIVYNHKRKAKK